MTVRTRKIYMLYSILLLLLLLTVLVTYRLKLLGQQSHFYHVLTSEAQISARAQVAALGGTALICYQ